MTLDIDNVLRTIPITQIQYNNAFNDVCISMLVPRLEWSYADTAQKYALVAIVADTNLIHDDFEEFKVELTTEFILMNVEQDFVFKWRNREFKLHFEAYPIGAWLC